MNRNTALLLLASSLLTPAAAWAQAATPPPGASPSSPSSSTVGEVVVTAQRRTERLLDVPISISVVSADKIRSAGVVNTRDLAQVTPGLVEGQAGYVFQPSIRGISSTGTSAGDEANVATYVDNVYIAATGVTAFNLANIDHIEVLKGPQGTLFGRNATGGAIRVVTSAPEFTPHFNATASVGFTGPDSREVSAYGTTAITDKLAASVAAYFYDDDGYFNNADPNYNGERQGSLTDYVVRGKLLYKPTENLKITTEFDYGYSKSGVELTTAFVDNINSFKNVTGVIPATGPDQVSTNEQNYDKGDSYGGYLNIEYKAPSFTFTSITAVRQVNLTENLDNDRTNLPINRNVYAVAINTVSQEFNLASDFRGPLNFIAGLYYFHEDAANPYFNSYAATLSPVMNGVRTITKPLALASSLYDDLKTNSYSAFGEATYKINRQFSIVGGVRYSLEYKDADSSNLLLPNSPAVIDGNHWGDVTYRATLNYHPADDMLLYASTSTGFKSGMINAAAYPYPNHHDEVSPENVTAYEVGYKARLFHWLDLSASAFHYDYKNIQLTVNNSLSADAGTVGINILENAARATITGADLDMNGRLNEHWSGQFGFSWLPEAKYSYFPDGISYVAAPGGLGAIAVASDLSGTRILRSPKSTFNIGVNYETGLAGGKIRISTNYYYTASQYLVVGQDIDQPAYGVLGSEIGWTDPSTHYTVSIWGRNLTDQAYYISGLANTGGFSAVWAKPRELGLRIHVDY